MPNNEENQKANLRADPKDHLANERTFLAWIRTSIGIMAFGFVIEKFALFLKQIAFLLGGSNVPSQVNSQTFLHGYSSFVGILLVAFGALISLFAFVKYKKIEKQLINNTYQSSSLLDIVLTTSVLAIGVYLIVYLINSV